jgi:hypothetical protein
MITPLLPEHTDDLRTPTTDHTHGQSLPPSTYAALALLAMALESVDAMLERLHAPPEPATLRPGD